MIHCATTVVTQHSKKSCVCLLKKTFSTEISKKDQKHPETIEEVEEEEEENI